jgi:hypothetical protein
MKTRMNKIIAAAALAAVLLAPAAYAQEKGSAKGGASKLVPVPEFVPVKPAEAMKCAACKDVIVTAVNRELRGAGARDLIGNREAPVIKHLCATCGATFEVRGHGKTKRDVPVHVCGDCLAKAKTVPIAAGAAKAEVGKISGTPCPNCKDGWVVTGYQRNARGYDPLPKYSLKHLCPDCRKAAAR